MAKGTVTKATKSTTGGKAARSAKLKAKPAPKSKKPAASVKSKKKPETRAPKAPATAAPAAAAPTASAAAGAPGLKKKNVKRGAPPMLPRRMARRPEPGAPGAAPPVPRPAAPPGSLHAPARAPEGAEGLKQRLSQVMGLLAQLRGLKRTLNRQFFEAGLVLQKLSEPTLYSAKGYGSFDKFIEREVERELSIGRQLAQDLVQIVKLFQREPAEDLGLDRLKSALRALWPEPNPATAGQAANTTSSGAIGT